MTYDYFCTDPEWIRAARLPTADAHGTCVAWLEFFFNAYGDSKPNEDEVLLNVSFRHEVYEKYARTLSGVAKIISESRYMLILF